MKNPDLRHRTKEFALRVIKLYCALPKSTVCQVLGNQVLRSGTSVAANYREACRARSDAELQSKLGQVEQELDETLLWMELLVESESMPRERMTLLHQEGTELIKMVVTAIKTLKERRK